MIPISPQLRRLCFACALMLVLPSVFAASYDESFARGREAMRAGDYGSAVTAFAAATQLRPDEVDGWFRLGLAYSAADLADEAISAYQRALALDPQHARALNNIGNVRFRRGEYDQALTWYERALELRPDYLLASFHYGWVLHHFNRNAESQQAFERCLRVEARNDRERAAQFDALFYLGTLRFRGADYQGCAARMEQVLRQNREHVEARYYLGMSYRRLGRTQEAREQLEIHRRLLKTARRTTPVEKMDP